MASTERITTVEVKLESGSGVTLFERADGGPCPLESAAVTVNVTGSPFCSPSTTVRVRPPETTTAAFAGNDRTT
jgi:hypothetical protein